LPNYAEATANDNPRGWWQCKLSWPIREKLVLKRIRAGQRPALIDMVAGAGFEGYETDIRTYYLIVPNAD